MLLITHLKEVKPVLAFLIGERIYDCDVADARLPELPEAFLERWQNLNPIPILTHNRLKSPS